MATQMLEDKMTCKNQIWNWAFRGLLSEDARKAYDEAEALALTAYNEARVLALTAYNEAWALARKAPALALKAYGEAQKAYDEAMISAQKAYDEARALAFATAYLNDQKGAAP